MSVRRAPRETTLRHLVALATCAAFALQAACNRPQDGRALSLARITSASPESLRKNNAGLSYANPVLRTDCPDPGVLRVETTPRDTYYMVCTGGSFPIRASHDLVHWESTGAEILPGGLAPWSPKGDRNWAPEIHRIAGSYVAYFTATDAHGHLAIGAASARSPLGPWTAVATPLVEDPTPGVIDPTLFSDTDGRQYLYWKRDGNAIGQRTEIFVRALRDDALGFAPNTEPTAVLLNDPSSWEDAVVEAPWVVRRGEFYYLFYSGNVYDGRYRTGVARSRSPAGPFEKHGAPILANNDAFLGPGHGSVVTMRGADYFVYHAWRANEAGNPIEAAGRQVMLDRIDWVDGWPRIADGTPSRGRDLTTLQPDR